MMRKRLGAAVALAIMLPVVALQPAIALAGATGDLVQVDRAADSGYSTTATIDASTRLTNGVPEANGGTGSATYGACATLGPFFVNDNPASGTTQATLGYFNTATATSRAANDILMPAAGKVVGMFITSDAARTGGTATAQARINGSCSAFNGGAVALDGTNTTSDSSMVVHGSGVSFSSGQTVGCCIVSAGTWSPTTADLSCWVVVSFD